MLRLSWSPDGHYLVSAHAMNNSGPTAQIIEREGWKTNMDFVGHRKAVTVVVSLWASGWWQTVPPEWDPHSLGQAVLPRPRPHVGLRCRPPRASTRCRPVLLSSKLITEHIPCILLANGHGDEYHQSQTLIRATVRPAWPLTRVGLPEGTQAGGPDKWPTPQAPRDPSVAGVAPRPCCESAAPPGGGSQPPGERPHRPEAAVEQPV